MVHGWFCEGGSCWTDEPFVEEEYYGQSPSRGDFFFHGGYWSFNMCSLPESWYWRQGVVFGKILHGMDVLKAIESVDDDLGGTTKPVIIVDCGQFYHAKCLNYHNSKNYGPKYQNFIKGSKIIHKYVYRSGNKRSDYTSCRLLCCERSLTGNQSSH